MADKPEKLIPEQLAQIRAKVDSHLYPADGYALLAHIKAVEQELEEWRRHERCVCENHDNDK